jgi:pteridine reductase
MIRPKGESMPSPKRVALVTGSGKNRVGRHVAVALAGRGYDIAVHYRTSADEAAEAVEDMRGFGFDAKAFQAELSEEQAVREMFHAVGDYFGRLDVLVNCAAIYGAKRLEDVTAEDVRRNFEVNLLGTFLCAQQGGLAMTKQPEGGCIVNFGDWALSRPYLNYAAYFAGKGAIPALTRCLAVELGTRNPRVRVNCIHPGPVLFPPGMPEPERLEAIRSTLTQHEGTQESVAAAVLFFVDNAFVTGVCLPVDGGRTIFAGGS